MKKVFDVSMPAYLVKFAEKTFWEGSQPPYPVGEGTILGKQIFSILNDKRSRQISSPDHETYLTIELADALAKRSPDPIKLSKINRLLNDLFKNNLVVWVHAQMEHGSNRYRAVESFLHFNKIEIDSDEMDRWYQFIKRNQNTPYFRLNKNGVQEENFDQIQEI